MSTAPAQDPNTFRQFTVNTRLPYFCTAKKARECGCKIPDDIPDDWVYLPRGGFQSISHTRIKETDHAPRHH